MSANPLLRSAAVPAICPKCHAPALHRSHALSSTDRFRRNFSLKRKYRCHVCSWNGWLDETRLSYPSVSLVSQVPPVSGEDVDIPSILLEDDRYPYVQRPNLHSHKDGTGYLSDQNGDGGSSRGNGKLPVEKKAPKNAEEEAHGEPDANSDKTPVTQETEPAMTIAGEEGAHNGFDMIPGMSPSEVVPVSTKVSPRFHHHSRHKAIDCPGCGEYTLFRSRTKGLGEFLRKKFTNKRPYRCQKCGWRGWVIKGL